MCWLSRDPVAAVTNNRSDKNLDSSSDLIWTASINQADSLQLMVLRISILSIQAWSEQYNIV